MQYLLPSSLPFPSLPHCPAISPVVPASWSWSSPPKHEVENDRKCAGWLFFPGSVMYVSSKLGWDTWMIIISHSLGVLSIRHLQLSALRASAFCICICICINLHLSATTKKKKIATDLTPVQPIAVSSLVVLPIILQNPLGTQNQHFPFASLAHPSSFSTLELRKPANPQIPDALPPYVISYQKCSRFSSLDLPLSLSQPASELRHAV